MSSLPGTAEAPPQVKTPTNYLDLYGLSKPPFGVPDDNRGYILFNSHRRAFEVLVDHLINGMGLILLRGEEGAGKSQMLVGAGHLAVESGLRIIKPNPPASGRLDASTLLTAILGENAHADPGSSSFDAALRVLLAPPRAVVLIDDLSRLAADCLPILTAIVQQTDNGPAVVVTTTDAQNHPEQAGLAHLARAELRIPRLTPAEVRQYIEQSLWIAGATTRRLISPDALRLIVAMSDGLPGSINRLMETAFTAGFARGPHRHSHTHSIHKTKAQRQAAQDRDGCPGDRGRVAAARRWSVSLSRPWWRICSKTTDGGPAAGPVQSDRTQYGTAFRSGGNCKPRSGRRTHEARRAIPQSW